MAGSIGDIGCLSFFANKMMTCGGKGGMLVANNDELAKKAAMKIMALENQGLSTDFFERS